MLTRWSHIPEVAKLVPLEYDNDRPWKDEEHLDNM